MAPKRLLFAAAAVLLLLLLLPSGSSATAVEYCKKGRDYPVKVSGVQVVPDPVVRGEPATFKISAATGSVNAANCAELAKKEDIYGFLVGSASLKKLQAGPSVLTFS